MRAPWRLPAVGEACPREKEPSMTKIRALQISDKRGPFELVEREMPTPGPSEVRVRVQACGVCHSDVFTKDGLFPGTRYPIVPGHEIAGVIDAIGPGVPPQWSVGQRVGVGWFGGHCGHCEPCRRGDLVDCRNLRIPGLSYDGGYAEAMIAPFDALAAIPDELKAEDAAPLLCAGVTTFNALRRSGARPGDLVAILGIGGLGHLGVQFAAKGGFHTVAVARGQDKAPLAKELGAHHYIDSTASDFGAELQKLGGADVILSTLTDAASLAVAVNGLAPKGKLIILGVPEKPFDLNTLPLILGER